MAFLGLLLLLALCFAASVFGAPAWLFLVLITLTLSASAFVIVRS